MESSCKGEQKKIRDIAEIDSSHEKAISRSKRGQEGITSEAKFLCWKFPVVKPNFVIFFDEVL